MLRIPGARPVKMGNLGTRSQQRSKKDRKVVRSRSPAQQPDDWDARFIHQPMPEYNPLADRHCEAYRNMLEKQHRGPKNAKGRAAAVMAPGGIRARRRNLGIDKDSVASNSIEDRSRKPTIDEHAANSNAPSHVPRQNRQTSKKSRGQSHARKFRGAVITDEIVLYLQQELRKCWEAYGIDEYHRSIFNEHLQGMSAEDFSPIIAKEIEDFGREKAAVQLANTGIVAREECIKHVTALEGALHDDGVPQEALTEAVNLLHSLRMLSLNVVECIVKWREQLLCMKAQVNPENTKSPAAIPFLWRGENYLTKMKSDTLFLAESAYSRVFNFSAKSDPFLVFPSLSHTGVGTASLMAKKRAKGGSPHKSGSHSSGAGRLTVPLPNALMKRVRASEVILMEEAVAEHLQ